jgi:hypothetical protein
MPYIKKKYYRIDETVKILRSKGATIEIEDLSTYTREQLIHPIIYLNSLAAHACERRFDGEALAVGHCFLSAYWNPSEEMTALFDTVTRDKSIEIRPLVKKIHLIEEPKIFSWQYEDYVFQRVWPGHASPKPYSENLKLEYFILVPPEQYKQTITLKMENFLIINRDLEFLISSLTETEQITGDDTTTNHSKDAQPVMPENSLNKNIAPTSAYFSKLGETGGDKEKIKAELLTLVTYELKEHKRGYTAFKAMLEKDYQLECFPSVDDLTYPGHGDCQDLYLIESRMYYTLTTENDKTERCEIAIKSLERYFTIARKLIKQPA